MLNLLEEPPVASHPRRQESPSEPVGENDTLARLMQMFRLLADETRLRILRLLLSANEYHVRGLCEQLQQSQPAVSHHLAMLHVAGLIDRRRQGKHNFYRLRTKKLEELLDVVLHTHGLDRQIRLGKYVLTRDD
jgi:ArsR family transcriptional regulator